MGANLSKDGPDGAVVPQNGGSGTLQIIPGDYCIELSWRVEGGGGRIDLDVLAMIANSGHEWVGACHKKDKKSFDGAFRHGGDKKARGGKMATEKIFFNLQKAMLDTDVEHVVFAITCFSNPLALANLAELRVQMFDPNGNKVLPGSRRQIKGAASAALAIYVNGSTGEYSEISNTYDVDGDAKRWRGLAGAAEGILPARTA